jgi:hypothetical protein
MLENSLPDGSPDGRAAARTNLFMAATLIAADGEHPVKIRDLSAVGAQVESALVPEVGSVMTLVRGQLSVPCEVSWRAERRCGLKFLSPISVQTWMANPLNREQQRVDRLVAVVKAGAVPDAAPAQPQAATAVVADDLRRVARLLENLGDALASDPAMVTAHGIELQSIDIALQTLTVLIETMRTDAPEIGASMARLDGLRISCEQAVRAT